MKNISPAILFKGHSHCSYTVTFDTIGSVLVMKLHCLDSKWIQTVTSVPSETPEYFLFAGIIAASAVSNLIFGFLKLGNIDLACFLPPLCSQQQHFLHAFPFFLLLYPLNTEMEPGFGICEDSGWLFVEALQRGKDIIAFHLMPWEGRPETETGQS